MGGFHKLVKWNQAIESKLYNIPEIFLFIIDSQNERVELYCDAGKQDKTDKVKIDELSFALAAINNPKPYKRVLCSFDINEYPIFNTKVVVSHNCL